LTRYKNELKQKKTPYAQQFQVILGVTFTALLMAGKEKKRKLVLLAVPIWKESKVYNKKRK